MIDWLIDWFIYCIMLYVHRKIFHAHSVQEHINYYEWILPCTRQTRWAEFLTCLLTKATARRKTHYSDSDQQQIPILCGLTRPVIETKTFRTRREHKNHYSIEVVFKKWIIHTIRYYIFFCNITKGRSCQNRKNY